MVTSVKGVSVPWKDLQLFLLRQFLIILPPVHYKHLPFIFHIEDRVTLYFYIIFVYTETRAWPFQMNETNNNDKTLDFENSFPSSQLMDLKRKEKPSHLLHDSPNIIL